MLAPYGHLVASAIHEKNIYKQYIGLDACAVNLMRPAMYRAYHHITVMGKRMLLAIINMILPVRYVKIMINLPSTECCKRLMLVI